ncbi:hypothetical protein [Ensifer adhaerens]|uniref:hypothetical protein n=1 Tax=Ensifer adhaerens TaxID=106592 RepID=UPI00098EE504|nr:hypothetical protein [Ensifer adhaerens]
MRREASAMNAHVPEPHGHEPEPSENRRTLSLFKARMETIRARLGGEATSPRAFLIEVVRAFVRKGRRPFTQSELDQLSDRQLAEYASYVAIWFERMTDEEFGDE